MVRAWSWQREMLIYNIVFEFFYFNRNERKKSKFIFFREQIRSIQSRENICVFKCSKLIFFWKNIVDIFFWKNRLDFWV